MNTALLLSGGNGNRLHMDIPKQYIPVCGRMLVTYALEPLLVSTHIDAVMVVAGDEWREAILEDAEKAGLDTGKISGFAAPGANRQCSIVNGLRTVLRMREGETGGAKADRQDADSIGMRGTDTVLIHDAARPFLSRKLIGECYAALAGHDGVMPVLPMKDTVYLSSDGKQADGLLERRAVYAGQAPELFLLEKYYQANRALLPERIMEVSGSAQPAVMAGMDIAMIPGDEGNFKVTTEADLQRFRAYMEGREAAL